MSRQEILLLETLRLRPMNLVDSAKLLKSNVPSLKEVLLERKTQESTPSLYEKAQEQMTNRIKAKLGKLERVIELPCSGMNWWY